MNTSRIFFRTHAIQRMFERQVSVKNVSQTLQTGEIVEDYSAEMPEPSRLILGFQGKRPFHIVMSEDPETGDVTIITVYIPDPNKWNKNFMARRS